MFFFYLPDEDESEEEEESELKKLYPETYKTNEPRLLRGMHGKQLIDNDDLVLFKAFQRSTNKMELSNLLCVNQMSIN